MIKILNFLNRLKLPKIKQRVNVSGVILIIILLLDLHRFGAWYIGNQSYIKPYGLSLILVSGLPLFIYVLAAAVQYCVRHKCFTLLYMSRIFLFCLPLSIFNPVTIGSIFLQDSTWMDQSIFRPLDFKFFIGIAAAMGISAGICMSLWILGMIYKHAITIPKLLKQYLSHNN
jgi:hypothetical protein